jgi:hypothetical protein
MQIRLLMILTLLLVTSVFNTSSVKGAQWTKVGDSYETLNTYGEWYSKAVIKPQSPTHLLLEMRSRTITGRDDNNRITSEVGMLELVTIVNGKVTAEQYQYTKDAGGEKREAFTSPRISLLREFRWTFRSFLLPSEVKTMLALLPNWWPTDDPSPTLFMTLSPYSYCSVKKEGSKVVFAVNEGGTREEIEIVSNGKVRAVSPRWFYAGDKYEATVVSDKGDDLFANYEEYLSQLPAAFLPYLPELRRARGK